MAQNAKDSLDKAAAKVSKTAETVRDKAEDAVAAGTDKVREVAHDVTEHLDDFNGSTLSRMPEKVADFFRTQQREHPTRLLLVAVAAASVFSASLARRNR